MLGIYGLIEIGRAVFDILEMGHGRILAHEAYDDPVPVSPAEIFQDVLAVKELARHGKMTDYKSLFEHAVFANDDLTRLAEHLFDRVNCDLSVVGPARKFFGDLFGPELKVRHIDIRQAVQHLKRFHGVISSRVDGNGDLKTRILGDPDAFRYPGCKMYGSHQVYIVCPFILQFFIYIGKFGRRLDKTFAACGY